ncbi:Rieske 2Fe-2S domain-containing protein [Ramlibacter sp. AW1]|uniref:Rieske 2Fe-2S domain-containing protein n=1 Tax=Ramlibacter aurantiacus TaxID=2801330 RepID=A0A936ZST8_9BURK|nr:aromatic ring-hydroxylating dioxygenase subunit alpha [Ramlibacter aurantiacus]MBL0421916.1 Rieske 2Fe-2S domain-containing protein [Ramlibacter aurantiacus]
MIPAFSRGPRSRRGSARNAWYAAAWQDEIAGGAIARTILDQPIVFYRDAAGAAVALADRCPHRFAPLSKGKLVEGAIECPYHGLRFGSQGDCVHNPHGPIPKAARVQTFALLERHDMLWIWMGEPHAADPSRLPDFSVMADHEHHAVVRGYLNVPASYDLITDNLLDLSHAQFIHQFIGNKDSSTRNIFEMKQEGHTVWARNSMPGEPLTPLFRMMWDTPSQVGDRRAHMRWDPPSHLLLDVGFTECGAPVSDGPSMPSAHLLTPETAHRTHYFWAAARDCKRDDQGLSEKIRAGIDAAFRLEDEPMIRDCQARMAGAELMSLNPVLLTTDAAAVRARRVLAELIAQEQRAQAASRP